MAQNFNKIDLKSDTMREFVDKFNTLFDSYKHIDQLIEGVLDVTHGGTGRTDGRAFAVGLNADGSDDSLTRGGIASTVSAPKASTVDFDDLLNHGIYATESETNAPLENESFIVLVLRASVSNVTQIAISQVSDTAFFRSTLDNGETWSSWTKFISSAQANATAQANGSQAGWVELLDDIDSDLDQSEGTAATPLAVKTAYDHFETPATDSTLGTVIIGDGIKVNASGEISCDFSSAVTSTDKKKVANSYAVKMVKDALNDHIAVFEGYKTSNDSAISVINSRLDGTDQNFAELIPSGTKMLFKQASAPNGWTKLTDSSLNDAALRVVTGNSVAVESSNRAFSEVFGTNYVSSENTGGTLGSTVLRVANLPAHKHGTVYTRTIHEGNGEEMTVCCPLPINDSALLQSNNGEGIDKAHTHTFNVEAHSHDFTLDINYIDVIICEKN